MVHRTHALCLLSRALAFDAAAEDANLGALVLSCMPLAAHPPPPAERVGGITVEHVQQVRCSCTRRTNVASVC
jgi:hypothetical protein